MAMNEEAKLIVDTLRYCEESGARCGGCPSGINEQGIPNCHSQSNIANLIESLSAQLDQVTRERDAAMEDLKDTGMLCVYCLHEKKSIYEEPCNKCSRVNADAKRNNWQWRGVEKGVEGC